MADHPRVETLQAFAIEESRLDFIKIEVVERSNLAMLAVLCCAVQQVRRTHVHAYIARNVTQARHICLAQVVDKDVGAAGWTELVNDLLRAELVCLELRSPRVDCDVVSPGHDHELSGVGAEGTITPGGFGSVEAWNGDMVSSGLAVA